MAEELREWRDRPVDAWRDRWGVPELHVFGAVGSTNDVARERARKGAPEGTVVLADAQTRGRGRRGRSWHAAPGRSLILSMVLRPRAVDAESVLSLRLGLAAARAIEMVAPLAVGVKWPNDLVVDGRKVGGMLCEGVVEGGRVAFVVAGTGINVRQADDEWPEPLAGRASSLSARAGRPIDRAVLAGRVIGEWLQAIARPADRLAPDELAELGRRDVLRGRAVTVDGRPAGVVRGVEPDGALRLDEDGTPRTVVAGTIRAVENPKESGA